MESQLSEEDIMMLKTIRNGLYIEQMVSRKFGGENIYRLIDWIEKKLVNEL